jgi:DNA helicase II / ATP-dependent DNA helicase PcrA
VILLEQNFRSTQTILDAANAVISKNPSRIAKNLFTDGDEGEKIRLYRAGDEYDEGRWVASELRRLRTESLAQWNQMAVFYRTNAQSRVLEEEMLRANVPYRVISGMRFYDRKEIKNALAYARLIVNPRDEASARRVINEPKRGIGDGAQAKLGVRRRARALLRRGAALRQGGRPHGRALQRRGEVLLHARRAARAVERPGAARDDRRDRARVGHGRRAARREHRRGLLAPGEPRRARVGGEQYDTLMDFVERMALVADSDQLDGGAGAISMMTLHVAKGLEFPAVVITGLEETIFPHRRALSDDAELEEERRLCYVGITRAMRTWSHPRVEPNDVGPPRRRAREPLPPRSPRS